MHGNIETAKGLVHPCDQGAHVGGVGDVAAARNRARALADADDAQTLQRGRKRVASAVPCRDDDLAPAPGKGRRRRKPNPAAAARHKNHLFAKPRSELRGCNQLPLHVAQSF